MFRACVRAQIVFSVTCTQGLVALTQSIQSQRLINSALRHSSYLQSPVALRSDQKVQGIQLSTDRILIASSRAIKSTNHTRKSSYTHSTESTFTGRHIITFDTNHKNSFNGVLVPKLLVCTLFYIKLN